MNTLLIFPIIGALILLIAWPFVKRLPEKEEDEHAPNSLIGEREGGTYF